MLVWSLISCSMSEAGAMLSLIDPSLLVRLVASMPLKNRLVLVVRVPLTEGEMLPVPLISTGGRSALTPASDDKRWVKLPVDVGTASSSALVRLRAVAGVVTVSRFASAATCTVSERPPTSKVTATDRVVAASTITPLRTRRLNPSSSNEISYVPDGSAGMRQSPSVPLTVCCVRPVCAPLAVTVTPGSTAPLGSLTVPDSVPVGLPCAPTGAGAYKITAKTVRTTATDTRLTRRIAHLRLASGGCLVQQHTTAARSSADRVEPRNTRIRECRSAEITER